MAYVGLGAAYPILIIPTAAIGQSIGVYFGGKWMGGNGRYLWTLTGSLAGAGVSLLSIRGLVQGDPYWQPEEYAWILTAVLVVGGSILGYHLSASDIYESNTKATLLGTNLNKTFRAATQDTFHVRLITLSFHL